jgi:hypothetical protein
MFHDYNDDDNNETCTVYAIASPLGLPQKGFQITMHLCPLSSKFLIALGVLAAIAPAYNYEITS